MDRNSPTRDAIEAAEAAQNKIEADVLILDYFVHETIQSFVTEATGRSEGQRDPHRENDSDLRVSTVNGQFSSLSSTLIRNADKSQRA